MVIIPGINPFAPSAMFVALTKPTQNVVVSTQPRMGRVKSEFKIGIFEPIGIKKGQQPITKAKITNVAQSLIFGERKLFFTSSTKPRAAHKKTPDHTISGIPIIIGRLTTSQYVPVTKSPMLKIKMAKPPNLEAPVRDIPCFCTLSFA